MTHFALPHFVSYSDYAPRLGDTVQEAAGVKPVGSKAVAGMLLAAVLASVLVVADQLIDTWADGHLLAGWVALWVVIFVALALLVHPLRRWTSGLAAGFARSMERAKQRRLDAQMWEYARHDPRVMAELQTALVRNQDGL